MDTKTFKCRRCRLTDNIAHISQCIYETDQYIYPQLCNEDRQIFEHIITQCLKDKSNVFYHENILLAFENGEIIGLACLINGGKEYRFSDAIDYPSSIAKNIKAVENGYFLPTFEDNMQIEGYNLINFCVRSDKRRSGTGRKLLEYLLETYCDSDIYLETISDNIAAVTLYKKCGFRLLKNIEGFKSDGESLPCSIYVYKRRDNIHF